jgi:hypothetical protein
MRVLVLAALTACVTACLYDEKELEGPLTCLGMPGPTTAPMLVNIHGHAVEPSNLAPLPGATVALQNAQMNPIFTAMADAQGSFAFTFNTNGTPATGLDLLATMTGRLGTYFYPTRAVTGDVDAQIVLLSTTEAMQLGSGAGVNIDASHGVALLTIEDCNGSAFAGATVSSSPPGAVRYFNGVQVSMSATATDAGGVAMIANLTPGPVTISTTVKGTKLPDRIYNVIANTIIQTVIEPAN